MFGFFSHQYLNVPLVVLGKTVVESYRWTVQMWQEKQTCVEYYVPNFFNFFTFFLPHKVLLFSHFISWGEVTVA